MEDVPCQKECSKEGSTEEREVRSNPYHKLIGCLLYLSVCSRPDTSVAVSKLAVFVINPGQGHWLKAKRVLRYLKGTQDVGRGWYFARVRWTLLALLILHGLMILIQGAVGANLIQWRTCK
jgi:hypothetical protein